MPANRRALALYNELTGKERIYAEELDVDKLASDTGVSYFLAWIQTRFMEVEITNISSMMSDLFRRAANESPSIPSGTSTLSSRGWCSGFAKCSANSRTW